MIPPASAGGFLLCNLAALLPAFRMGYPVQETIVQGQTLLLEFRFRGEVLTDATPRVEVSPGMGSAAFTVELDGEDTVIVRCTDTDQFGVGTHTLELWLDWEPSTPVWNELVMMVYVVVTESEGTA